MVHGIISWYTRVYTHPCRSVQSQVVPLVFCPWKFQGCSQVSPTTQDPASHSSINRTCRFTYWMLHQLFQMSFVVISGGIFATPLPLSVSPALSPFTFVFLRFIIISVPALLFLSPSSSLPSPFPLGHCYGAL